MKLERLDLKRVRSVASRVIGGEIVRLRGGNVIVYGFRDKDIEYVCCRRANAPKIAKPDVFCWDIALLTVIFEGADASIPLHHAFQCWKVIETILSGDIGWLPPTRSRTR